MSLRTFAPLCFAVISAGCFETFNTTPTNPDPTIEILGSHWESATPDADKLLSSCTNFQYTVSQAQSGSLIGSGTFTATQAGQAVNFEASGTANGGGITNCAITLSGSGTLSGNELVLNYKGQTCQGPVSGTEKLRLKT